MQISFCFENFFRSVINENTDLFCYAENFLDLYYVLLCKKKKKSDIYLIKVQICFVMQKKFKSVFNENTD